MRDHVYAGVETGQWLNCCTGEKDSKDMQQLWLRQRPPPTGRGPRAGWAGGEEQRQAKHKGTASAGGGGIWEWGGAEQGGFPNLCFHLDLKIKTDQKTGKRKHPVSFLKAKQVFDCFQLNIWHLQNNGKHRKTDKEEKKEEETIKCFYKRIAFLHLVLFKSK